MGRKPNENTQVIPRNNDPQPIIPVNVVDRDVKDQLMLCTVSVKHLNEHTSTMVGEQTSKSADPSASVSKAGYSMRVCQTPKKVTHRTSGCK